MADDKNGGWRQFQKVNFDSKKISKRMKKAEGVTTRHAHKFIIKRLSNIRSVRRQIIGWLLLVGCMIVAVGVQLLWFQQSYQKVAASEGGTYAEASLGPLETLNPLYATSDAEIAVSRLLFSSLFSFDATGHLRPDLAESMKVDETGKVYTLKLRPQAKWHDGTQLTAKDVAFTVNLIKDPETRSSLRVNWQDVEAKALDDQTVQFTLPAVYAAFPYALNFAVLPEHILGKVAPGAVRENAFSRSPIGSGMFAFRLFQTIDNEGHKAVHMNAFESYYGGQPKLNRFEVHAYASQNEILKALRIGEVSAASDVASTNLSQVDAYNYKVTTKPINSGVYALFNNNKPLLKDKSVRTALRLATDTAKIRESLATKPPALSLPFIEGQLTGDKIPRPPLTNVVEANKVLDKAGWKLKAGVRQKKDQTLRLTITTTKDDEYEKVVDMLAEQWRAIGIMVETKVIDTNSPAANFVQGTLQPRNYDVLVYELLIGADPDVYAYWHSSQIGMYGYNFSNYVDSTSDAALASARSRLEAELRNAKYKTFARQWVRDVPAIGIYQPMTSYVANRHVRSLDPAARLTSPADRFANVLYWTVREEPVYKTP